jgi:hypothetical protein
VVQARFKTLGLRLSGHDRCMIIQVKPKTAIPL